MNGSEQVSNVSEVLKVEKVALKPVKLMELFELIKPFITFVPRYFEKNSSHGGYSSVG